MKPLHVVLLMAGAAAAGGLAVKMTEPPRLPVAEPAPPPAPAPARQVTSPVPAEPVPITPAKPSPFITRVAPSRPEVYVESLQPATRKSTPVLTAKATAPVMVPKDNPSPLFVPPVAYEAPAPPAPQPRRVTLQPGMLVAVRFRGSPDGTFSAELAEPLVVDGLVIAERGARVAGRIVNERNALELTSISTSDGQKIAITTDPTTQAGSTPENIVRFRLTMRVTITERRL